MKAVSFQRREVVTRRHIHLLDFTFPGFGCQKLLFCWRECQTSAPAGAPWRPPVERGRKLAGGQEEEEAERHLGGPGNQVLQWT